MFVFTKIPDNFEKHFKPNSQTPSGGDFN